MSGERSYSLRRNAASVGDYSSERAFVIREIDFAMEHYRKAWRQDEPYYRGQYGPNFKWLVAGANLLVLKTDSFVWGHGARLWKALIAAVVFLVGLSIVLALTVLPSADQTILSDLWNNLLLSFVYHVNLFLGVPDETGVDGVLFIDWLVVIARYLVIGVLVAALYRRLSHR